MAPSRAVLAALAGFAAAAAMREDAPGWLSSVDRQGGRCGAAPAELAAPESLSLLQTRQAIHPGQQRAALEGERLPFRVRLDEPHILAASALRRAAAGRQARKPVLWLHIHKAGGTFMCEMTRRAGERVVDPNMNCNWHGHDMFYDSGHPELGPTCEERKAYWDQGGFTWGHIERELWASDVCHSDFNYGVMLREPTALMHSIVNFQPEINMEFVTLTRAAVANGTRPGPCLDTERGEGERWKIMDNFQTRILAPGGSLVPAGQINETHVQAARQFVLDNFQYVQRLEDLPSSGASLFRSLGWPDEMAQYIGEPVNTSPDQWDFSPEDADWLRQLNRHDIALWESFR